MMVQMNPPWPRPIRPASHPPTKAPAVLALVLGVLAEQHLRRALSVSDGDLMTFVERPISLALLIFILLVLVLPPAIRLLRARQAGRPHADV